MLRLSTLEEEGIYQASQWIKLPLLCEADELLALLSHLEPLSIYPLTGLFPRVPPPLSNEAFAQEYGEWIEGLKKGISPSEASLKKILAAAFTSDPGALWAQKVSGERYAVKISQPVVQVQSHFFTYSEVDGVYRSLSMGPKAIFWGIQLSYPQVYQDPKSLAFCKGEEGANAELFWKIRRWVREHTTATPLVAGGNLTHVPIRLGKQCKSWIGRHPELIAQGISYGG